MIHAVSAAFRGAPGFRGKARLGSAVGRVLDRNQDEHWATMRDGTRMRLDLGISLQRWAYWTGEHDHAGVICLLSHLPADGVALDVGANVGLYAVPLARIGRVVAFEPMPENAARLRENLAANGLDADVHEVALADFTGSMVLKPELHGRTGNAARTGEADGINVAVRRLDDVAVELGLSRCDVVKVDVEGGELEFLLGGESFIRHHKPAIMLELNEPQIAEHHRRGWADGDVVDLVRSWGYRVDQRTGSAVSDVVLVPHAATAESSA